MTRLRAGPRPARAEAGMDVAEGMEVESSKARKRRPSWPYRQNPLMVSSLTKTWTVQGGRAMKRYVPCAGQAVERGGTRS